jgi:hypothetical protein
MREIPKISMLQYALRALEYGLLVFPCVPRGKLPYGKLVPHGSINATRDPEQIREWWSAVPDANIGCRGGVIVDCDSGLSSLQDAKDFSLLHRFPETLAIRTGRRNCYGVQFHFSGQATSGRYSAFGISGEVRSKNLYGLWDGSIHPDTGQRYEIAIDAPRAEVPENILGQFRVGDAGQRKVVVRQRGQDADYEPVDFMSAQDTYYNLLFKAAHAGKGSRHDAAHRCAWYAARCWAAGVFDEWRLHDMILFPARSEREIKLELLNAVAPRYEKGERNIRAMLRDSWNSGLAFGRLNLELYAEDFVVLQSLSDDIVFHNAWSGNTAGFNSAVEAKDYLIKRLTAVGCEDPQRIVKAGDIMDAVANEITVKLMLGLGEQ